MIKLKTVKLDDIEIDIIVSALIGYAIDARKQMKKPIGDGRSNRECRADISISKSIAKKLGRKL